MPPAGPAAPRAGDAPAGDPGRRSSARPRRSLPLAAVLLLLTGAVALGEGPVGSWAVDTAALRGEFERILRADIARMPPAQRPPTEAVLPGRLDDLVHRSAWVAEFRPDGTVLIEDYVGHRTGSWAVDGAHIRLQGADGVPYLGTLEGDTMELVTEDEPAPTLVLRRR